jgi:predicted naringenin-chalcone synthase
LLTPRIIAVGTAVPQNRYSQEVLLHWSGHNAARGAFFLNSDIEYRHLYFDASFRGGETIDEMTERGRRGAAELGSKAILCCLQRSALTAEAVDFLATTTCTVSLCPHLDTVFIRDLKLKQSIRRAHIGDTGCASAMVSLQAAWNHLHAYPDNHALIAAVEMCSAAYYRDGSIESVIGEAIFADGAASVCLAANGAPGFEVLAHKSLIRSENIHLMGFDFPGGHRKLVLSKDVRTIGAGMLKELVESMLAEHGLTKPDIRFWVLHSAGRKVLDNAQVYLGLASEDLTFSRSVLRDYGNLSSATVLFVLDKVMSSGLPRPGDIAIMAALGPGFAAEGALLRWAS